MSIVSLLPLYLSAFSSSSSISLETTRLWSERFEGLQLILSPRLTITFVRTSSFTIYAKIKEGLVRREILLGKHLGSTAALGFLGGYVRSLTYTSSH